MRKIYSLVLMATMLLVGTNAWAVNVPVAGVQGTRGELQTAINDAATGTTLTLQNDFNLDGPVWLGTADYDGAYKSIILDLNGHNISMTATTGNASYMFVLSHGELLVRNSSATLSLIQLSGTTGTNYGTQIFTVFGSYRSTRWNEAGSALETDSTKIINTRNNGWFSHLEIGQNVKIVAGSGILGTGISVDVLFPSEGAYAKIKGQGNTINYRSDIFDGNFGLAQGVKVDIYGDIEIAGKGESGSHKAYCVKVNGYTDIPNPAERGIDPAFTMDYATNYEKSAHAGDTIDVAFIHIHGTANLQSDNKSSRSTAVYSSGYSKMLIEGHCEGSIGVYASSGKVEINNAEIVSTSTSYTTPTGDGGVSGTGSAVVVNSRDGYTGEIEVTISGDSKVTASSGYAIEEIVTTTADTTKVESVTIEGGTIEGGNQGAIIVSDKTASDKDAEVVIYGGKVSGNTQVGAEGDITDILPTNGSDTTAHVTVVTDPVSGKTTIVVSEGAPVPASEKDKDIIAGDANTTVNWKHLDATTTDMTQTLLADMTLKELEINQNYNQTLILGDVTDPANPVNVTLTVDHMVLGYKAQIIVNPGSKLLVTGTQGMVAPVTSNLVLKATATSQATFVIAPEVTSNKQPNATVQLYTTCYKDGENSWKWQRFASPLTKTTTVTNDHDGSVGSNVKYIDDATEVWTNISAWSDLRPFTACAITNQLSAGGVTYTFPGKLMGNVTDSIVRKACKWNYYGNSYMAPMSVKALSNALPVQNVDPAIYYWDVTAQGYKSVTAQMIGDFSFGILTEIPAMGFFVLKNTAQEAGALNIDYNNSIFRHAQGLAPVYNAPVRHTSNSDRVCISVIAENGYSDVVYLLGSDNFTPEYEAGADVEKLMNNGLNLYVAGDINLSALYTDNLLGATLTLQSNEAINYSMTFNNVYGEYALRDNMTGRTIAIVEGATYNFSAQPNETIEGRFQIVGRQEMPTAVETVEEMVNTPKAIYTVMGQYVGETTDWNNLPAGVYVVDGVKVIK